ncbi:MAG: DEAD/DEAH box helicase [Proteobacteria bacterium]|nr:DEAD/DEAH box helicase [Pseudomonadota bacterium]
MPSTRAQAPKAAKVSKARKAATAAAEPRLSRHRRPPELPAADWQAALRRQFGREQVFTLRNLGSEPVFSEFLVGNDGSGSSYRVSIRGSAPGSNGCTCLDYATNQLGTCKHIEFTLAALARKRGGKSALARGFTPAYSELRLDHAGARRVRLSPGSDCPPPLLAQARKLFDANAGWALPQDRLAELPAFVAKAAKAGHELRCEDAVWQFAALLRDADHRRTLFAQAYPQGAADPALAQLLKVPLYPYQAEGALFAARAGRALIGDEMGLGKTVQSIAAAELMTRHLGVQRVLVIGPTSLKHQWKNEFARFAGRSAQVVHGLRARREQIYAEEGGIKITHYETLARDADLIAAWAPDLVIADEAQRIKNWNTIAARALKRIASPYALVLTGTPLENRLEELISIVQFVDQHRLGPTWRLLEEHQQRDEAGRVVGYQALDRIGRTLAPILLRRRKAEVLAQLPERVDQRIFVPLTPEQRLHHDENGQIVTRIVARWRKTGYLSDTDQRRLQCALQNMRMACNSTYLLDRRSDHGHKVDELMALLDDLFQTPGSKAVVFSQWRLTHELIARRLAERGWGHVRFDGNVPGEQRGALVERFHADPDCRLFLSTDAGGVGLNLQHAAAVVVNMDLPWNPAVLEQRIGRVHRLGQRRGVQVAHFIGQGSIEEGMLSVLAFKSSLFAGVLDGGESEIFLSGSRLSKFMQSVEQVAGAMGEPEAATERSAASAGVAPGLSEVADAAPAPRAPNEMAGAAAANEPEDATESTPATSTAAPPTMLPPDPWPALLQAGAALLQGLAGNGGAPALRIERDAATGQHSLRLPLPEPALMRQIAKALEPWLPR